MLCRNWLLALAIFFSLHIWAEELQEIENVAIDFSNVEKIIQEYNLLKSQKKHQRYIFISFSMSDDNLKALAQVAEDDVIFVLNGLVKTANPRQAIINTYTKVASIFSGKQVDINPTLFEELQIKLVPVFAIVEEDMMCIEQTCLKRFDKISGNITYDYAWEKIKNSGEYGKYIKIKGK